MKLGRLGVWIEYDEESSAFGAEFAKRVEQWGYSALWLGEAMGRDVLVSSSWLLANTSSLIVASGIANIYARDAMAMVASQIGLNEQSGGRFLLAMGVSHIPLVTALRGHGYGKPVATMHAYLEAMKQVQNFAPPGPEKPKTLIAALGPKMLELSRDHADGAHPYNVTPAHTAEARRILGPGKLLCVEQKVMLERDPSRARANARKVLQPYLQLSNYLINWRRLGFSDGDFSNGGSDRLMDAVVAWGDEDAIVSRIQQHWEAGADHVCIQTVDPDRPVGHLGIPVPDVNLLQRLATLTT